MATKDNAQDEKPLDRKRLKFIQKFRKMRNIYKAAEAAGIGRSRAGAVFNEPAVQEELERQENAVLRERAYQEVRDEKITNQEIDRELLGLIRLPADKNGSLKLEAIRLGAVMTGRIQAGNTRALEQGAGAEAVAGGWSYRALVQVQEAAPILPETQAAAGVAPAAVAAAVPETKPVRAETKPAIPATNAAKPDVKRATGAIRVG